MGAESSWEHAYSNVEEISMHFNGLPTNEVLQGPPGSLSTENDLLDQIKALKAELDKTRTFLQVYSQAQLTERQRDSLDNTVMRGGEVASRIDEAIETFHWKRDRRENKLPGPSFREHLGLIAEDPQPSIKALSLLAKEAKWAMVPRKMLEPTVYQKLRSAEIEGGNVGYVVEELLEYCKDRDNAEREIKKDSSEFRLWDMKRAIAEYEIDGKGGSRSRLAKVVERRPPRLSKPCASKK